MDSSQDGAGANPEAGPLAMVIKAAVFAAQRHCHQRRKGVDAAPYINHPLEVADILASLGGVQELPVLLAALLHDTVEDTATTLEELEAEFGRDVRLLVAEVTDDKRLPKAERKRLQVEHAPSMSQGARQIKIADKISNLRDLISNPPADWSAQRRREYVDWASQVVARYRPEFFCDKTHV